MRSPRFAIRSARLRDGGRNRHDSQPVGEDHKQCKLKKKKKKKPGSICVGFHHYPASPFSFSRFLYPGIGGCQITDVVVVAVVANPSRKNRHSGRGAAGARWGKRCGGVAQREGRNCRAVKVVAYLHLHNQSPKPTDTATKSNISALYNPSQTPLPQPSPRRLIANP